MSFIMKPVNTQNENLILNRSFDFALMIISLVKTLRSKREYVFADQLLRSGTSIGANVEEANAAISKKRISFKNEHLLKRSTRNQILAKIAEEIRNNGYKCSRTSNKRIRIDYSHSNLNSENYQRISQIAFGPSTKHIN